MLLVAALVAATLLIIPDRGVSYATYKDDDALSMPERSWGSPVSTWT
jgi:hypothetical protein